MHFFSIKKYVSFSTLIAIVIFLLCSVVMGIGVRQKSQAFYFQDETDHVTMGWMMNTFDKKLYQDLSTNHQPLPVFTGAVLAKALPYQTLFDLIDRLRLSMFVGLSLAGLLLTIRFKQAGAVAYLLTYSVGFYFFAWHVLAESLIIPAVLYIFLYCFEKLFFSPTPEKPWLIVDAVAVSAAFFLIIFSLLPLWPFCVLSGIYIFFSFTKKQRIIATSCFAFLTVVLFACISPADWYRETIFNNIQYLIPDQKKLNSGEMLQVALYPFVPILHATDRLAQMFLFPLLGVLVMIGLLWHSHKKNFTTKHLLGGLYLYVLLISLNTRVAEFPVAFYQGFHLLPYVAAFFALFAAVHQSFLSTLENKKIAVLFFLLPFFLFVFNVPWMREQQDKLNEYYVQYGTQDSYARLITVLEQPGDAFFSGPDGQGYINMMSGLPIAGRQLFHLQWAYRSPALRTEFHQLFAEHPPAFVLLYEDESGYHTDLQPILQKEYTEFLHDGKRTHVYIKKERATQVTSAQQQYLQEKDFTFAQE